MMHLQPEMEVGSSLGGFDGLVVFPFKNEQVWTVFIFEQGIVERKMFIFCHVCLLEATAIHCSGKIQ